MTTSADIVNRAVQLIGGFNNQGPVSGSPPNFDGSPIGVAAGVLYVSVVQTVGRQFGWDFSRNIATLSASGNTAPFPWAHEYLYPASGIEVRQLLPSSLDDANNPLPVNWSVGNNLVSGSPTKVIWTDLADAMATISNQPNENTWDPLFTEAVERMLASELAMAIESKPDTAKTTLEQAAQFEQMGEGRRDT